MDAEPSPLRAAFVSKGFATGVRHGIDAATVGPDGTTAEVAAAERGPVVYDRATRGAVVLLRGSDRAKYLHGQCTQEVKALGPGEGGAAWILDARGSNLGSLRFQIGAEEIQAEVEPTTAAALAKRLSLYVVTADVAVERPTPSFPSLGVAGSGAAAVVAKLFPGVALPVREERFVVALREGTPVLLISLEETGPGGFEIRVCGETSTAIALAARLLEEATAHGATLVGDDAVEALRIAAGRPRFGIDVDAEHLPAETGTLDRTTSFTKGCYAGQEVVAKQQYLGKPRKLTVKVAGPVTPPEGTTLFTADGAEAGRLTSHAPNAAIRRGLATVKPTCAAAGMSLRDDRGGVWTVL
jgi:folate-binding protein YgfZ